MTVPNDSGKPRDETEELIANTDQHDSETEATLPEAAPTANATTEPPLPEYFLAGVIATGFSAAFVAVGTSFFGLQGTVVGAVAGAMAGSTAAQLTKRRLLRIEHRARTSLRRLSEIRGHDISRWTAASPAALATLRTRIPWRSIGSAALIGIVGFGLGASVLSAFELVGGRPVSAVTAGEPSSGTTFQRIVETVVPPEPEERRLAAVSPSPTARSNGASATVTPGAVTAPGASPVVESSDEIERTPRAAESLEALDRPVSSPEPDDSPSIVASPPSQATSTSRATSATPSAQPSTTPARTATPSPTPRATPSATGRVPTATIVTTPTP